MLIYLAGIPSRNKGIHEIILGGGDIQNHLMTHADLGEINSKLTHMFIHLTDTTARIQGHLSCKKLMAESSYTTKLYSYAYPKQREQWEEYYRMLIHLAEGSNERGQYQSLIDMRFPSHLMSYAYRNCLDNFTTVWTMLIYLASAGTGSTKNIGTPQEAESLSNTLYSYGEKLGTEQCMDIYLAGHCANKKTEETRKQHDNHLTTFADKNEVSTLVDTVVKPELLPRILIDSGAFTAYTTGKVIKVEDYGSWAIAFKNQWEKKVKSLHFFNLDVIGDQKGSDINLKKLEVMGLKPLPIFTYGADIKNLEYYLSKYEYIGLGGLVGLSPSKLIPWLNYCFKYVFREYKQSSKLPKIHLLGVTKEDILMRYPSYSCDSSGWVSCLRFGNGKAIGKAKIPRYTESPEALKVTIATLRSEIRKYKELEEKVTKHWTKQGIIFED